VTLVEPWVPDFETRQSKTFESLAKSLTDAIENLYEKEGNGGSKILASLVSLQ
jgi:hypothetical protein